MRRARRQRALEARAEHPGARTLTAHVPRRASSSASISARPTPRSRGPSGARRRSQLFDVPQLVARRRGRPQPTLPSFLYFTDAGTSATSGAVALPWDADARRRRRRLRARPRRAGAGAAGRVGEIVAVQPARRSHGARSCRGAARRERRLSPVEASARVLAHSATRGITTHARGRRALRLERQPIVLTVPASFDEEARELTVEAARSAGLDAAHAARGAAGRALRLDRRAPRAQLARRFGDGALLLVCDVGGGTTDFSLIRARRRRRTSSRSSASRSASTCCSAATTSISRWRRSSSRSWPARRRG